MTQKPLRDFWIFFGGETVSNLGSSFTIFALPLLVFKLTGSALNLAAASAAETLPYLCFSLLIGAWVDRLDRKRMMIVANLLQALCLAYVPLLAALGVLSVWWLYGISFLSATLKVCLENGQLAVLPSLVSQDQFVAANGRIQASFSFAQMVGPVLAGALLFVLPLPTLVLVDAASFLIAACALWSIKTSFNLAAPPQPRDIFHDIGEGLHYVWRQPLLRAISTMTPILNVLTASTTAQLVLLAVTAYHATGQQISLFYTAASLGIVFCTLLAGPLRQHWPFSAVALGAIAVMGGALLALGVTPWYGAALLLWGLAQGGEMLFNVNTRQVRQALVPNHLLGRVMSVAQMLGYSSIPLGSLLGGVLLHRVGTSHIAQMYSVIGVLVILVALVFSCTALGHARKYLPDEALVMPRPRPVPWRPALGAFGTGMRATVPFALGIIAPMALYGVTALQAGLSPVMAQAMILLVFSGAVLPAAQALQVGTPLVVVGLMIALLNLRHALYSARLAPALKTLPLHKRLIAGFFTTDESFAVTHQRLALLGGKFPRYWWLYLVGAGVTMWIVAQGATAMGIVLGAWLPIWDGMSFLPTLAFACLTVLSLKRRGSVVVAGASGLIAVFTRAMPLGLGLLTAVSSGVVIGMIVERVGSQLLLAGAKEEA